MLLILPAVLALLLGAGAAVVSRRARRRLSLPLPPPGSGGRTTALLRPHRWTIAAAVAVDVAVTALGLAAPWPVMAVIDKATSGTVTAPFGVAGAGSVVPVAVGAGVALVAMIALLEYLSAVLAETATNGVGLTLRAAAFTKLLRLPGRAAYPTGDLVTRLTGDVARVQDAAVDRWRVVVANAFALVGMVAVLATLNPLLAAVTAAAAPLAAGLLWLRRRQVADVQRLSRRRTGELQTHLTELVRSLPAVRSFGREDHEAARLDASGREAAAASVRAVAVGARLAPLADVLLALTLAVVLAVGAAQVHAHRLSVGGLVVFLTYLGALQQPVRALSTLSRTLGRGQASRERLDELLAAPELPDPAGGRTLGHRPPVIALHHVGFRYADGRVGLDDVSGWMPAGRMTALLGPNGAGKSTLLNLLARLDDPAGGVVTFDGVDARAYDLRNLRSRVALVPQDGWLLDGTLADNIAYGSPGATDEAVRAAGEAALVDEFADRLPEGWATPLGEGGHALSAGQRRRVALARAVLQDRPVLLLDEPTTGLDAEAERLVIEAIRVVAAGRTTVVVTHEPALAALADHVVTLRAGRVAPAAGAPEATGLVAAATGDRRLALAE